MRWTLPIQVRWVTVCVRNNTFTEATLKWWLDSVLSSNCEIHCTVECGRVTKHQWVALCAYLYRFMQRRGELRVPLHIFVDGFKAHKQAPCRCPTGLAWVAENAYLLFYRSSRITIGTPNINLSSRWVLDRIGDPMWWTCMALDRMSCRHSYTNDWHRTWAWKQGCRRLSSAIFQGVLWKSCYSDIQCKVWQQWHGIFAFNAIDTSWAITSCRFPRKQGHRCNRSQLGAVHIHDVFKGGFEAIFTVVFERSAWLVVFEGDLKGVFKGVLWEILKIYVL